MSSSATYDLSSVRSQLPILHDWTYLNTGTVGIMARPIVERHLENIAAFEYGGHVAQGDAIEAYESTRRRLGELLEANPNDLAFTRNATDGINLVAARFPLSPGDEVITTTEEHPAMVIPWLAACDRAGATLRFVKPDPEPEKLMANISEVLGSNTRGIALSHVSCETGKRLPVERLRDSIPGDVAILVDASQSVGQFPVSVPDLNADFVIGNGHKWLCGPKGTGFAWFASQSLYLAPPAHFASDTFDPTWSRSHYQHFPAPRLSLADTAQRYEFGTRAWHLFGALKDAIDYLDDLNWASIEAHMARLTDYLKAELAEIPGVTVHTPISWEASSGLTTFSVAGWHGEELSKHLWNHHHIAQRRVEAPSSVRISCAYFTTIDDLDILVERVRDAARTQTA